MTWNASRLVSLGLMSFLLGAWVGLWLMPQPSKTKSLDLVVQEKVVTVEVVRTVNVEVEVVRLVEVAAKQRTKETTEKRTSNPNGTVTEQSITRESWSESALKDESASTLLLSSTTSSTTTSDSKISSSTSTETVKSASDYLFGVRAGKMGLTGGWYAGGSAYARIGTLPLFFGVEVGASALEYGVSGISAPQGWNSPYVGLSILAEW